MESRDRGYLPLPGRWLLGCLVAVAQCLVQASVLAASLQVAPVSLDFTGEQAAQGMWLTNTGAEPLNVQLRVFAWSQSNGEDLLTPTSELVPSSSILSIAPGGRQFVRLLRLMPVAPTRELSYRVLVDELPTVSSTAQAGLRFLLRYSIPLFVLPPGAMPRFKADGPVPPTDLALISVRVDERAGKSWLVIGNRGRQRLRLSQLSLTDARGMRESISDGLLGYVLAGQERQWQLPVAAGALREGTLKAKLNDDQQEQNLPMDRAGQ